MIVKVFLPAISVACASAFRAGYVLGGEDADITDWPFMVSVQNTLGSLLYGGVLIDSTHVLTSGFCVDLGAPSQVQIMVGSKSQSNPGTVYQLSDIRTHEDYFFPNNALLFVDGDVVADGVTVDFAVLAETDAEDFVGSDCETAGWGFNGNDNFPDILQFAPVNVISVEDCQDDWAFITEHICTRDPNGEQAPCADDIGGPLTCIDSTGNRVVAGTVSGGEGVCGPSIAVFYARTSFFNEWIQENL